ncbi:MAG: sulfatase family protein [Planctomycetota bacterium]|jgi:choline-sulfatase
MKLGRNVPGSQHPCATSRRRFLEAGAAGAGAWMTGVGSAAPAVHRKRRPNFLFLVCDQLGLDALSAHGCADVSTPNIDRLVRRGVSFLESHSTNPVCSPARSSLLTGRMPVETGVVSNNRPIHSSRPNLGQWLGEAGYQSVYCGKWHLPGGYPDRIDGFRVLPVGGGQGDLVDTVASRTCQAYLKSRSRREPFLLVASLLQPHDICYWAIKGDALVPEQLPFPQIAGRLPELPPNHKARPRAPEKLDRIVYRGFSEEQWRYYIYVYYRQVEMVDADVGRILDALEDTSQAENTVILLTSDHGEGRGRHRHVQKWYPYEESVKVPMIVSCPGRIAENLRDATRLVSGIDVMNTLCDYAGIGPPAELGRSLRPLLEERATQWREFVASEHHVVGRMIRTERFKYVHYRDDPVEQLFDVQSDPWETKNLYDDPRHADALADHRKLLAEWQSRLEPVQPTPDAARPQRRP